MNVQIVIAQEKDVPQIIAMISEFAEFEKLSEFCEVTEESLTDAMFGESSCVEGLMTFEGEKPIGYALFYENFASFRGQRGLYLEDLYVKPEFRGHRIGESFLDAAPPDTVRNSMRFSNLAPSIMRSTKMPGVWI